MRPVMNSPMVVTTVMAKKTDPARFQRTRCCSISSLVFISVQFLMTLSRSSFVAQSSSEPSAVRTGVTVEQSHQPTSQSVSYLLNGTRKPLLDTATTIFAQRTQRTTNISLESVQKTNNLWWKFLNIFYLYLSFCESLAISYLRSIAEKHYQLCLP